MKQKPNNNSGILEYTKTKLLWVSNTNYNIYMKSITMMKACPPKDLLVRCFARRPLKFATANNTNNKIKLILQNIVHIIPQNTTLLFAMNIHRTKIVSAIYKKSSNISTITKIRPLQLNRQHHIK
jgi:hypothetical protein